ncbi:MAG: alanine dehydrogenase [bacterium]|nr:alanine dehydrogenase [bacterium]
MKIGVPTEIKTAENRVSMTPHGAAELTKRGHRVYVQKGAGRNSGFEDEQYRSAGCLLADTARDVFQEADMIVKVKEPQPPEIEMVRRDQIVFTYFHFAADRQLTLDFQKTGATAVAYETVELPDGSLPLLIPMSEVAGRMATQEGARFLEKFNGGRGVLLGGVPGVPPGVVTILGGGVVGINAAKIAAGMGAEVYILDSNLNRLRTLENVMPKNVMTVFSNEYNLRGLLPRTDLLIGAVLVVGAKAPRLVTRDMLSLMRPGSVLVDVSVDQGGCIETSKPTTHDHPTFVVDGVIHYGVANMPGAVPYTSTIALTNATLPYVIRIADVAMDVLIRTSLEIRTGLNMYKGEITHSAVAQAFDLKYTPADKLI